MRPEAMSISHSRIGSDANVKFIHDIHWILHIGLRLDLHLYIGQDHGIALYLPRRCIMRLHMDIVPYGEALLQQSVTAISGVGPVGVSMKESGGTEKSSSLRSRGDSCRRTA